ncbi:hypothetical protein RIB2604_00608000 [Aspergillus luchuensis]|uniref:Uncharacterized protein n=1 Tax=Aspergillus kawachii TaxID=1069201 RepID=A0A146F2S4_ASPKA|nr:hypothetical protein RIB2604_00608000 [Aspergillus luchuensis]
MPFRVDWLVRAAMSRTEPNYGSGRALKLRDQKKRDSYARAWTTSAGIRVKSSSPSDTSKLGPFTQELFGSYGSPD